MRTEKLKMLKMQTCQCKKLYKTEALEIAEYAFSGSICRIRKFETEDGVRHCLTIFSVSDYKHMHFPHNEYKWLIYKLYARQSPRAIFPTLAADVQKSIDSALAVEILPFNDDLYIKFGTQRKLTVGPVTAFGLVKTSPFADVDVFSINKTPFTCDPKWDICTCKTCPVFQRLINWESSIVERFGRHKLENVILFQRQRK